jgi:iron complex outermembrane recepter protein
MNSTIKLAVLASLGTAAGFLSPQSRAATAAAPADSDALATIVVTAEKREEPLKDVPMSITALGGNALDKLQYRDFGDYAAMVPGLSLVTSQPGLTRLTLRGQNAGGVGSTVAVYLDESPFGSSSALLNGSIISGDFDTWDLQRIEVLRGPQGTLYGASSEGGLLKFVTNAPELGKFSGAAEVTGDIVGGSAGGDVRGMVNLPVGDKVAIRLSGFDEDDPGYIDDVLRNKTDINTGHKYGGRGSILVQPTDDISVRFTATQQQSRYAGTNVVDVDPRTLRPVHGDLTQARNLDEPSSFKYENYAATLNWNVGPFSILSNTAYGILKSDQVNDFTNAVLAPPSTTLGDLLGGAIGPGLGASLDNRAELHKFTQEVRLSSPATDFFEWQVGGYFTRETGELSQHLLAVNLPAATLAALPGLEIVGLDSTYKETSAFANMTFHIIPQFDIQAGGRYSKNEQTVTESLTGLLVVPQIFSTPSEGHVYTYSVAPRWHVTADTMVYGRIATGYRPGGPNALPPVAPPDVPRQYGADKTTNIELGIRSTQLAGALSLDLAIFHVDWKDIQLLEQVDNTGINGNGGKARSVGVEWTFGYIPVQGLTLTWTGAYTDAKLTTDAPAVNGFTGDRLPYAPKIGTSIGAEYDWSLTANYRGFVGSNWSYVGARSTDFGSSVDLIPVQVRLPSYNTLEARVGFENDVYRMTLFAKNLTDKRGIASYASSGAPGLAGETSIINPRTIGVTLSAKF